MGWNTELVAGIVLLVGLTAFGVGVVPQASAGHGSKANYTVQPVDAPDDRQPGISDASYQQFAVANESVQYVDYFVVTWDAGDLSRCGVEDTEELGIDRGGNNSGTETDEGLLQYVKDQQRSEDRVVVDFYDEDDVAGETTYINESDEIVSYQTDCFGNPEEPGWYQITAELNGTGWDDERKEASATSHYFWICDCESEAQARDQLGPPPSESGAGQDTETPADGTTATPTVEETDPDAQEGTTATSSADETDTDAQGETTATPTAEATDSNGQSTSGAGTDENGGDTDASASPGTGDGGTHTATRADEAQAGGDTPDPADQPGFGALTVLVAFAVVAGRLLIRLD